MDLGDGDLAQLRFTLNVDAEAPTPDVPALDRKLDDMVRGWVPSVEEALAKIVSGTRATKLALTYAPCFPQAIARVTPPRMRRSTSSISTR